MFALFVPVHAPAAAIFHSAPLCAQLPPTVGYWCSEPVRRSWRAAGSDDPAAHVRLSSNRCMCPTGCYDVFTLRWDLSVVYKIWD